MGTILACTQGRPRLLEFRHVACDIQTHFLQRLLRLTDPGKELVWLGFPLPRMVPMDEKILHITRTTLGTPALEIPPPAQEYNIQRRGARVPVRQGAAAKLHLWDVTLIDLSLSGTLIEHTVRVRVGDSYHLSFQVDGLHVRVKARAVRSFASHRVPVAGGERQIVYRTGLEFADVTADTAKSVSAYLDRLHATEIIG